MTTNWNPSFKYWAASLTTLALIALAWVAHEMFRPLLIGSLLAFILYPLIASVKRRTRLSHSAVVPIVLVTGLVLIGVLLAALAPVIFRESQALVLDLQEIYLEVESALSQPVTIWLWTFQFQHLLPDFSAQLTQEIDALPENAFNILEATGKSIIWSLVAVATTYYLLKDWTKLRDWLLGLPPQAYREDVQRIYAELRDIWLGYLRGNLALMFIVGVVFSLAWFAIGLPGALLLGIIAGVLTIIPDLGPAIAAAIAILVALVEGSTYLPLSNFLFAFLVLGIYLILINIKSLWLRPKIFGHSVHMHEGIVFIAILAAVVLQGILGAIIIVPLLASISVLGRYVYRRLLGLPPFSD